MIASWQTLLATTFFGAVLLAGESASPASAEVTVSLDVIALRGAPAPDGNGVYLSFDNPVLNESGQIAFKGSLTDTTGGSRDNTGIFLGDASSPVKQIVREGQTSPDGNGKYSTLLNPALNDLGQVAFASFLNETSGGFDDNSGVFFDDGSSPLRLLARRGQAALVGDGVFRSFGDPRLNASGQIAFMGLTSSSGSGSVWLIEESGQVTRIATGSNFLLNAAGQFAHLRFNRRRFNSGNGIFLAEAGSPRRTIVTDSQIAPDGNGKFFFYTEPALNDLGQVAFSAALFDSSDEPNDNSGVFVGDGLSPMTQIAREGAPAPRDGEILSDFGAVAINNAGRVAYWGASTDPDRTTGNLSGIFFGDGVSPLTQLAHEGQTAPDGDGFFSSFGAPAINASDQVAFLATVSGTEGDSTNELGIFLAHPDLLTTQVVRVGDPLLGSTISNLGFVSPGDTGFNNAGQIAFTFSLADGRVGVGVASVVPEPSSLGLLAIAALGLTRRRCFAR